MLNHIFTTDIAVLARHEQVPLSARITGDVDL